MFGGNVQVLTDAAGFPLHVSPALPGSTHDLTTARTVVLLHPFPRTALHRPDPIDVPADKATPAPALVPAPPTSPIPV